MTEEAFHPAAPEPRLIGLFYVQGVEHHASAWFEREKLVHVAARNGPDCHFVIEVQRARILRIDDGLLEAGLGEDQRLRIDVDAQLLEQAGKKSAAIAIFERR